MDVSLASQTTTFASGMLLVQNGFGAQRRFILNDPVTGAQLAERTIDASGGGSVGDALWALSSDDTNWNVDRYTLPDLSPTLRLAVPHQRSGDATFGTATDGTTETVVISADGTLTAFDARTGSRLGNPVPVPLVQNDMLMWVRANHPGQAIVAAGDALELWDVPAGRRLGSGDLTVTQFDGVVTSGDTLVALTNQGDIEVRSLPGMERIAAPIPAPEVEALLGFAPDGQLVTATDGFGTGQVIFWDLDRRTESGRMRPNSGTPHAVDGGPVTIDGTSGLLPEALDVRPEVWRDHLCRLLPPRSSDTATSLLPGADSSPPCG